MKNTVWFVVAVAAVLGGFGIAYFYWQNIHKSPEIAATALPPAAPPQAPPPPPQQLSRQLIETLPAPQPELPPLEKSDRFMLDALATLLANKSLMHLVDTEDVIPHIVATIDNLPRRIVPAGALPVEPPPGKFLVSGNEEEWTMDEGNAGRYAPYMKLIEAVNPKKLVALYIRLYPLFQEAYESLGYPKQYFNDRLLVVLDDLLAAPEVSAPLKLVRPKVFYRYADPDLERRSAGQKILMRIGTANERKVKSRLWEIRQELLLHLRQVQMAPVSKQ